MNRSSLQQYPGNSGRIGFRRSFLRPKSDEHADRVNYVELLFDLVFVFALTQLSRFLVENQTLTGALQSAILVLAIWWVWIHTTWVTNWLDPERLPVRVTVLTLALVGFVMSTSIYESYGDLGIVFAIAYATLQLGRTIFMILAVARHNDILRGKFQRVLVWLSVAGVLWIVGALLPLEARVAMWVLALLVEYVSAGFGFRVPGMASPVDSEEDLSGSHIVERCSLFIIIALGESFLVSGFAFADQEASLDGIVGIAAALIGTLAMWWLYFDRGERTIHHAIATAKRGSITRIAFTYVHAVIVAGIVLTSIADEEMIEHPEDVLTIPVALTLAGGPLLYLLGLALFRWVVTRELLVSHLVGIALLVAAFATSVWILPRTLGLISIGVLVVVAVWETVVRTRRIGALEKNS